MLSQSPDTVVTFGDSLSDSGAIFGLTGALLADPLALPVPGELLATPGYAGVFSNGPVHTQRLVAELGAGLDGYAVGGARAADDRTVADYVDGQTALIDPTLPAPERDALLGFDLELGGQVDRFLAGEPPFPGAQAPLAAPGDTVLATFFIGLNDFSAFAAELVDDPLSAFFAAPGFVLDLIDATSGAIRDIAASPLVDQVALYMLPSLGVFPQPGPVDPAAFAFADRLVDIYNSSLRLAALEADLAGTAEVELVRSDLILEEIAADPGTFGFLAQGPFYFGSGADPDVGAGPSLSFPVNPAVEDVPLRQIQFFDVVHPTAAVHGILGAFGAASLTKSASFFGDDDDLRFMGTGDDLVLAGAGADTLYLGLGQDIGLGGLGNDDLRGNEGADIMSGGSGDDALRGGIGNDVVAGAEGDDVVIGNDGDDLLIGGRGSDLVAGHRGDDTMIWIDPRLTGGPDGAQDVYYGGQGTDILYLVTDAAGGGEIAAALAALDAGNTALGGWDLSDLGLQAFGTEQVVLLDGGLDVLTPEAELIGAAEGLLADASLWGFV